MFFRLQSTNYELQTNKGQAMLASVVFFVSLMLAISFGFSSLALSQERLARLNLNGKQSYFTAEAGQEDVIYRLMTGKNVDAQESIILDGHTATTTTTIIASNRIVVSKGSVSKNIRNVQTELATGGGASFNYGVQVGDGGLLMKNDSLVSGNVYSNGPVTGQNDNIVKGDVVSAGPTGIIDGVSATSSAYAHTINNSFIEKDAFCQVGSGNTVLGDSSGCPNITTPDQPASVLPISDAQITQWESSAESGGIISTPCPYTITSDTTATLGPVKITCDLKISGDSVVTLEGPVWVEGNIEITNDATIKIDPTLGSKSVAVIADLSTDRTTSSKIILKNTTIFEGSGLPGSYILFVSQNNSSETGGYEIAIEVQNDVSGDLLAYAGHGEILIKNDIILKEVTAYKIQIQNTANVIYETGLSSLLFSSGPSGGYTILNWSEVE